MSLFASDLPELSQFLISSKRPFLLACGFLPLACLPDLHCSWVREAPFFSNFLLFNFLKTCRFPELLLLSVHGTFTVTTISWVEHIRAAGAAAEVALGIEQAPTIAQLRGTAPAHLIKARVEAIIALVEFVAGPHQVVVLFERQLGVAHLRTMHASSI